MCVLSLSACVCVWEKSVDLNPLCAFSIMKIESDILIRDDFFTHSENCLSVDQRQKFTHNLAKIMPNN